MFNRDFYPTPPEVVHYMISGLDLDGKTVFDPQAGKGNIIDIVKEKGAKTLACENNADLAMIVNQKADRFLKSDFFEVTSEEISHVDFIIMNPPFSKDLKHILHAWDVCPGGCQIVTLCNTDTLELGNARDRRILQWEIMDHGRSENISKAFKQAERTTDVNVTMINLFKEKGVGNDEFEGYFDMFEEHEEQQINGIVQHNDIVALVNRYVGSVKMFNDVLDKNKEINSLMGVLGNDIQFGAFQGYSRDMRSINREDFKKELQKNAWKHMFSLFNMEKFMTKSVMEDLNKFVEQQTQVPFTVRNIFKMVEMVTGTQQSRMKRVIVEIFDDLTKHYKENRYQLEGWKTNSEYRVNKKFIRDWDIQRENNGRIGARGYENFTLDDLTKAMCFITGKNYADMPGYWQFMNNNQPYTEMKRYRKDYSKDIIEYESKGTRNEYRKPNTWYDFGFFRIKGFLKGTLHVEFKDEKEWEMFNKIACEEKGFMLASRFTSDYKQKPTDIEVAA